MDAQEFDAVVAQLDLFAQRLVAKIDQFTNTTDPAMAAIIGSSASEHATQLLSGSIPTARLLRDLIGRPCDQDEIDTAFWATPVGRAVAWVDGYSADGRPIPRKHAAAILGVSRQRISQLEDAGALVATDGGLEALSVTSRLRTHGYQGGTDERTTDG